MYNEPQKSEFMNYAGNEYWRYVFENSAEYEREKDKDLACMETDELLEYLLGMSSFTSAKTARSRISRYIDWCVIKGYASFNWIAPAVIANDFLQDIYHQSRTEFYISRTLYENYVARLRQSSYGVYIASFFTGLYEGFTYEELAELRISSIDKKNKTVKTGDDIRPVSDLFIQLLLETAGMTKVESRSRIFRYQYSLYSDSIWKSRKENISSESMVRQFRCLLDEAKRILDEERLTKTIIRNSGYFNKIFYRLLEDGIDARELKIERSKDGMAENRKYDRYFENSVIDKMDMRKFIRSFRSYLQQVELP